jgi:hypothetical protein
MRVLNTAQLEFSDVFLDDVSKFRSRRVFVDCEDDHDDPQTTVCSGEIHGQNVDTLRCHPWLKPLGCFIGGIAF